MKSTVNLALVKIADRLGNLINDYAEHVENVAEHTVGESRVYHMLDVAWDALVLELKGQGMTDDEQVELVQVPFG